MVLFLVSFFDNYSTLKEGATNGAKSKNTKTKAKSNTKA